VAIVGNQLRLADQRERGFPKRGAWTSPEITPDFPLTELLPSWLVDAPEGGGARFEVRTRDAETEEWSPWLHAGFWGKVLHRPGREVEFEHGRLRIDVLRLERPADRFQVRVNFEDFDLDPTDVPALRRLAVSYSGSIDDPAERASLREPIEIEGDWVRDLPVPFRTQQANPRDVSGSTCSPTSVSMLLEFQGANRPTMENALAIYDPENALFGNWNRAIARAGDVGLDGWLTRTRDWDQVKASIAAGQPLIASIAFREGEFPSNVLNRTGGHLIVVRGLTPEGDAIVNDPASADKGDGVVYVAEELQRAWFGHGGVTYVIRKTDDASAPEIVAAGN
jgi:hypothetical protein